MRALDAVSLTIEQGEFFGLLGPNGAGKTTLINILAGLALATSGTARVMGHDVVSQYREARRALGVVPQELVFDPFFTVREALDVPVRLLRPARQPRLDRRGDAPPRPHRAGRRPTCARSPAA